MEHLSFSFAVARPEDALIWVELQQATQGKPPGDIGREIERFNSAAPDVARNRYLVWAGGRAVACVQLHTLGRVVEIRDLAIGREYLHTLGLDIADDIADLARGRGEVVTAEYPEAYSPLFLGAGFRQNTRTRMGLSLSGYSLQNVTLHAGVRLRHPRPEDEPAVAAMTYRNYKGTPDADMVSSSPQQAQAMIRAMFGSEYSRFLPECSFLAEDEKGALVGNCLVGDSSLERGERLAWVLDISLAAEHRGKGLGRAMIMSSLNAAKEAGLERAGLIVTIGNGGAQALYRSLGFEEYGALIYEGVLR